MLNFTFVTKYQTLNCCYLYDRKKKDQVGQFLLFFLFYFCINVEGNNESIIPWWQFSIFFYNNNNNNIIVDNLEQISSVWYVNETILSRPALIHFQSNSPMQCIYFVFKVEYAAAADVVAAANNNHKKKRKNFYLFQFSTANRKKKNKSIIE